MQVWQGISYGPHLLQRDPNHGAGSRPSVLMPPKKKRDRDRYVSVYAYIYIYSYIHVGTYVETAGSTLDWIDAERLPEPEAVLQCKSRNQDPTNHDFCNPAYIGPYYQNADPHVYVVCWPPNIIGAPMIF